MEEVQVQSQGGKIYFGACVRRQSFLLCGGERSIYPAYILLGKKIWRKSRSPKKTNRDVPLLAWGGSTAIHRESAYGHLQILFPS